MKIISRNALDWTSPLDTSSSSSSSVVSSLILFVSVLVSLWVVEDVSPSEEGGWRIRGWFSEVSSSFSSSDMVVGCFDCLMLWF